MTMESRRDFFKTATVGALGTAGVLAGVSSTAEARPARAKHDLIIVGAGCGGLVCAVRAAQLGLKPLLLEKMDMPLATPFTRLGSSWASTRHSRRPPVPPTTPMKRSSTT